MTEQHEPQQHGDSEARSTAPGAVVRRRDEFGVNPWDAAVLVATVAVAVAMPVEAVFGDLSADWLSALSALVSVLFAVDIFLRLSRPLVAGTARIGDVASIRQRYLRGWFTVDLLAAIPFDVIAVAPGIRDGSAGSVLRLLAILRILRVGRIFVLQREWRVRTSINPAVLRLTFIFFWVALLAHWIACGWIAMDGAASGHPELPAYQQALYWTITTLTTVGYGDITPEGRGQVAYAMVVMGLGAAIFGYVVGNIASLLANIDVMRSRHLGRMETINNFMRDRHVPRHLQARVREYYNYLWESRMGRQSELLEDLPTPLRIEIALHLNRNILRKVPLFEGASETFLRELVLHFVPTVSIPGESIVRRGEIGHRIYFINKGAVEVLSFDESRAVATLSDGDFFGEMALLTSQPRSNTVRALEYCNLYTLDRESFDRVLESFPEFAADVRSVAERRMAESEPDD